VKTVVLAGSGAAALPETMVSSDLAQGLLWAVEIEGRIQASQPIWMVKHDQRYPSSLLRAFEAVIHDEAVPAEGRLTALELSAPPATRRRA